jgi:hypothetical protein
MLKRVIYIEPLRVKGLMVLGPTVVLTSGGSNPALRLDVTPYNFGFSSEWRDFETVSSTKQFCQLCVCKDLKNL